MAVLEEQVHRFDHDAVLMGAIPELGVHEHGLIAWIPHVAEPLHALPRKDRQCKQVPNEAVVYVDNMFAVDPALGLQVQEDLVPVLRRDEIIRDSDDHFARCVLGGGVPSGHAVLRPLVDYQRVALAPLQLGSDCFEAFQNLFRCSVVH